MNVLLFFQFLAERQMVFEWQVLILNPTFLWSGTLFPRTTQMENS